MSHKFELTIYYAYNQFLVYDGTVALPGCDWTDTHVSQGFARRRGVVNFEALGDCGEARVRVFLTGFPGGDYTRAIDVPLDLDSGELHIHGPEDTDTLPISVDRGPYRLTAAQRITANAALQVDLFLESVAAPLSGSEIVIQDSPLQPRLPLLEEAGVAGEDG